MATRTAQTKSQKGRTTASKSAAAKKPRRPSWKKVLEKNLILEGLSPAEARELVALSAE